VRCLVIADVHANLAALEAVLGDAGPFDEAWCLGDLVGYGPDPNECVDLIRSLKHQAVAGNHDYAAVGQVSLRDFNEGARRATEWTASRLTAENRRFLESLPLQEQIGDFCLVHGSVRFPVWEYIDTPQAALENLQLQPARYCLVGHTHVPVMYREATGIIRRAREARVRGDRTAIRLDSSKAILNPGSVGQPRDGDRRASYMLLEPETGLAEVRRVEYPVEVTQRRILEAGLPERNAFRLALGR
jgi:predicted phosphodiesterase